MTEMPKKPEQDEKGRFVAGNSGNGGRPKGSRNKLGESFVADMLADWEEHGVQVIQTVRSEKPEVYLKVVASILPKDLNVNVNQAENMTDGELIERLRVLRAAIGDFIPSEGDGGSGGRTAAQTAH